MVQKAPHPASRPGQMTAVMRAVAMAGPRVLRIGVVQDGQVQQERVITDRSTVTAGPSENSTFVVSSRLLGKGHALFQRSGADYVLLFRDGMTGRIALHTGVSELEQLKGQTPRDPDGWYRLPLTEDTRGKVDIDGTTFLFQFVLSPTTNPRPHLPASVLRGASGTDWRTTIIAAFAFLAHFMAVGAMYSDWLDPPVDDDLTLAGLVETLAQLPPPPPPEEKPELEEEKKDDETKPTKEVTKAVPKQTSKSAQPPGKLSAAASAQLGRELSQIKILAFATVADLGDATGVIMRSGDLPTGFLDADAAADRGSGFGNSLGLSGGGGLVTPGAGGGLRSLADTSAGTGGAAVTKTTAGPKLSVSVTSRVKAGSVSDSTQVIGSLSPGFKRCFRRGVEQAPDQAGAITLTIRLGPGGEVSSVSASSTGTLSAAVVECVKGIARGAQFAPPDGGSAVIDIPMSFVQQ
jgi:hypothetical protein